MRQHSYKSNVLPRGKACLTCRRRKMRCDGKRPVCTQCANGQRDKVCRYDDQKSKSLLVDHVIDLEQCLQQLQNTGPSDISPISLQDTGTFPILNPEQSNHTLSILELPDTDFLSADLSTYDLQRTNQSLEGCFPTYPAPTPPQPQYANVIIPPQAEYVPSELEFTSYISTFIDRQRPLGYLQLSLDLSTNGISLKPPIFDTAALWGNRLQNNSIDSPLQKSLLSRVLDEITRSFNNSEIAHEVIVATSLVALYLYSSGRLLEGKYYADAAASLAIAANLHQVEGWNSPQALFNRFSCVDLQRIFWNTFELGCWTVVTGAHNPLLSDIYPSFAAVTPWPSEVDSNCVLMVPTCSFEDLLNSNVPINPREPSQTIRAKSVVLFQMSGRISALLDEDPLNASNLSQLQKLENCIHLSSFYLGTLHPPPDHYNREKSQLNIFYDLLLTHGMLGAAMILLHHPFASTQINSLLKCQTWARKVLSTVRLVNETRHTELPPIIAICWAVAADVILQELKAPGGSSDQATQAGLGEELNMLLQALHNLSSIFPIAGILGSRVSSQYHGEHFPWDTGRPSTYLSPSPTSSQRSC